MPRCNRVVLRRPRNGRKRCWCQLMPGDTLLTPLLAALSGRPISGSERGLLSMALAIDPALAGRVRCDDEERSYSPALMAGRLPQARRSGRDGSCMSASGSRRSLAARRRLGRSFAGRMQGGARERSPGARRVEFSGTRLSPMSDHEPRHASTHFRAAAPRGSGSPSRRTVSRPRGRIAGSTREYRSHSTFRA